MPHVMGNKGPRLNINVTSDIIAFSVRGNSSHCMTATAIEQQYPWVRRVAVDIQTIRFTDPRTGLRCVYLTPRIVQEAIVDFDDGKHVNAFKFRLQGAMVTQISGRLDRSEEAKEREGRRDEQRIREPGAKNAKRSRKRLVQGERDSKHRLMPTVVGGRTPPRSGARREFGLRAFRRAEPPTEASSEK